MRRKNILQASNKKDQKSECGASIVVTWPMASSDTHFSWLPKTFIFVAQNVSPKTSYNHTCSNQETSFIHTWPRPHGTNLIYMISIYHNLFSCIYMYTVAVAHGPKGCVGPCGTCEGPFDRPHDSPRWHHRTTCVCQLSSSIQGNMWIIMILISDTYVKSKQNRFVNVL